MRLLYHFKPLFSFAFTYEIRPPHLDRVSTSELLTDPLIKSPNGAASVHALHLMCRRFASNLRLKATEKPSLRWMVNKYAVPDVDNEHPWVDCGRESWHNASKSNDQVDWFPDRVVDHPRTARRPAEDHSDYYPTVFWLRVPPTRSS